MSDSLDEGQAGVGHEGSIGGEEALFQEGEDALVARSFLADLLAQSQLDDVVEGAL